ncbi:N-acetyltransferase [Clostridium sp. CX1]|uniref:GNAT family N-acetyltransferase n=1 Tax=Clostridium sp. CX1 TaxID=2978346 RepID=UPI0021C09814|nr:N-acetyltransferase [Clostridium sp. CX1]MCT8977912.1 N-acetyltransferase [Clostridium sp. CX1]
MNIVIRQEQEKDISTIYSVVKLAFEKVEHSDGDEQNLVNRLRNSEAFIPELSLVAELDGEIVGHILFTKIKICENISLALGPLSVVPELHGKGIGGKLIIKGHEIAKNLGFGSVIVLGHPAYYPRFGYVPASNWGIKAPFEVPDECFMAMELIEGSLKSVSGVVQYAKEFFER